MLKKTLVSAVLLLAAIVLPERVQANSLVSHDERLEQSQASSTQFVDAFNDGSYKALKQFSKANLSKELLKRFGLEMYSNYLAAERHFHGGFEVQSVVLAEDQDEGSVASNISVKSKNTKLDYLIEFSISAVSPYKTTGIRIIADPKDTISNLSEKEAIEELSRYVDYLEKKEVFSGTLLLAKDDKVLLEKASGMASKRFDIKNNVDTRFNLGSMNKMFTSIAILRLIERRQLNLDDKLVDVLKLDTTSDKLKQIEIQHLLSHTSGIGRIDCETGLDKAVGNAQGCLNNINKANVDFEPGSQYRYSNDGMFVLGFILEQITSRSYYDIIQSEIYDVAGMSSTESLDLQFPVKNAAIGYAFYARYNQWQNNLFLHDKKGGPAGGGYSTVADLLRFSESLTNYKFLSKTFTQNAVTPKTELGSSNYGFGFIDWKRRGKRVVGHNGSYIGVSSQLEIHLDTGFTLIVLSNHSFGADPVLAKVHELFNI